MKVDAFAIVPHSKNKGTEVELEIQPLVLCKNCEHLIDHYGFMDDGYCRKMREEYGVKFKPKRAWFCADGIRKDDSGD